MKETLPILILQVLAVGPLHGFAIAQEIKGRSTGVLDSKEGTLYPALHALENKGLLTSYEQPCDNKRIRRYYKLTVSGTQALASERRQSQPCARAIHLVMEGT